jgi:hypothetical protein
MVERISGQLALKIEEIEMLENPNCSAHLGFKGSGWPPASTRELLAARYRMTSAEVEVDLMDAIGIDHVTFRNSDRNYSIFWSSKLEL